MTAKVKTAKEFKAGLLKGDTRLAVPVKKPKNGSDGPESLKRMFRF